jgi:transcription initiation factor TFIID subunit TAF12
MMVDLVSDFVSNLTNAACQLAKHRQGDIVECFDAQVIAGINEEACNDIEKNYNIRVPGFGLDQLQTAANPDTKKKGKSKTELHSSRVAAVREQLRRAGVQKRNARLRAAIKK